MIPTKPTKKPVKKTTRAGSFIEESSDPMTGKQLCQDFSESIGPEKLLMEYAKLPAKYKTPPATVGHILAMTGLLCDVLVELKNRIAELDKSIHKV